MSSRLDIGELVEEALSNIKQRSFLFIPISSPKKKTETFCRLHQQVMSYLESDECRSEKTDDITKQAFALYLCGLEDAMTAQNERNLKQRQILLSSAEKKLESARFTANK